ncbi:hypothetical protein DL98DRAFT_538640 [Cadophora sp. DSE1049]|nr:hypothetical protein DL98DRAFT_538640 [Cadophora sp. DSE1049]
MLSCQFNGDSSFGGKYGWVGLWGRRCRHPWCLHRWQEFDCIWLDSNGDPTPVTAFQVHFPEFNDKGEGYNSNTQYARSPSKDSKPVRSTIRRLVDDTRLVKSHIATHSAVELCESPTSAGPDFVSFAEGKFCDMKGRIVWDLCSETLLEQCFDADAGEVIFGDLAKVIEWA